MTCASPRVSTMISLRLAIAALVLTAGASPREGDAAKAVLSGKIRGGAGGPVVGAEVTLHQLGEANGQWDRFTVAAHATTTADSGGYEFAGLGDGYYVVSVERDGFARTFHAATLENGASASVDVELGPPASVIIRVEDEAGRPVAGARVREMIRRGVNGACPLRQTWLRSLGIVVPPSDAEGRLHLPPLPAGETVKLTLDHPELAPARIDALTATADARPVVRMKPGVVVRLHAPPGEIRTAIVDLRREPFDDPSTLLFYEAEFDPEGVARLVVAPGDYTWFSLQHEKFYVTPDYKAQAPGRKPLRIEPGRNQDLHFAVRRKVAVHGRVVDAETGKPVKGAWVTGEVAHGTPRGWADPPPGPWSNAGWAETDEQGWYSIDLAPGRARISFQGEALVPERDDAEITVPEDGSAVAPEFRVAPLRKVVGVVRNPDGTPAARAVVRLRGNFTRAIQPALTDDAGRFELQPLRIPIDPATEKRVVDQRVVAFDPLRPLAAFAEVRLGQSQEVELKLEPRAVDWPLSAFPAELSDWEQGKVAPAPDAPASLRGRMPPEIDACLWLNTAGKNLRLADLRGKYVLLAFWFIGCGPCHYDFPSLTMIHELYGDRVQVIGIHNNSSAAEAVRDHVRKLGLPFAVAVDHPDGRTIARFQEHGIPDGYPDYVLISPEGKVLLDDRTIPHRMLRLDKLEIIRTLLLQSGPPAK